MKVSQEEAKAKIEEYTDQNIFGTALLFLLIVHFVEPVSDWVTDKALTGAKNYVKRKFKFKLPSKK